MLKIKPKEIAFDIDGVFADTISAFIREVKNLYGIEIRYEDIKEYELSKVVNNEKVLVEVAKKILHEPVSIGIKPLRGATQVLRRLSRINKILFVTARPDKTGIQEWVKKYLQKDSFHIVATGLHEEKARLLKRYGIKYFVEDRLETCFILEKASITPIVFEQPWNQKPHPFLKVRSWYELEKMIDWNSS